MIIEKDIYSGEILSSRFSYDYFKKDVKRTGNIICYTAPMRVVADFMVDKEDLVNNDFIHSSFAMNFLIEIPDISLFAGVCFQRLFNTLLAEKLSEYCGYRYKMKGDDILVDCEEKKKASVSIAKYCNGAVLIHTGINLVAGGEAPSFAHSTNLDDIKAKQFMREAIQMFYDITADIFTATTKVI